MSQDQLFPHLRFLAFAIEICSELKAKLYYFLTKGMYLVESKLTLLDWLFVRGWGTKIWRAPIVFLSVTNFIGCLHRLVSVRRKKDSHLFKKQLIVFGFKGFLRIVLYIFKVAFMYRVCHNAIERCLSGFCPMTMVSGTGWFSLDQDSEWSPQ